MDTTNKLSEAQERERFEVVANEQGLTPGDFKLGAYLGWLLAKKDAAQATQAVSEPVAMQPAEAVAEFNNGSWRLRIGSVYMTAPNPPVGPQMVSEEYKVRMYAARINAEIRGGVAAFGCDVEARGLTYSDGDKISRCGSWCGLNQCAVSLKSAVVIHPAPASASEPATNVVANIVAELIAECERAMTQRDEFKRTGISTASHGGSHDTRFGDIVRKHLGRGASASVAGAGEAPIRKLLAEILLFFHDCSDSIRCIDRVVDLEERIGDYLAARPVADGEAGKPIARVERHTGSLKDMAIIVWLGEQPPEGTLLYTREQTGEK